MQDIKIREEKMKEKRKQTPFRDFVKEIGARSPLHLYMYNGLISRYPSNNRAPSNVVSVKEYGKYSDENIKYGLDYDSSKSFFENYQSLYKTVLLPCLGNLNTENADYCENGWYCKNSYLSFALVVDVENVLYSFHIKE